ncbi:RrF2 family transcriptional regulator [Dongshaea marina]|uniref:RrF2 family transcriptional regulator n=1 Tax=Dongshaea marina TaxID=2047966 RepID=UPI00131EFCB9|nr:Rrf2 family transcriptional regulator [Dongshaea marina]
MAANTNFSVAVHSMAVLGFLDRQVTSEVLATSINTNPVIVRRVVSKLVKAGLVHSIPGKHGGFELTRAPDAISLKDIYLALEEVQLFAIHANEEFQPCPVSCSIKGILGQVSDELAGQVKSTLDKIKLADVIKQIK